MAERMHYVDGETYSYSGFFSTEDLIKSLHKFASHESYIISDSFASGSVSDSAKNYSKSYSLVKEFSFYHSLELDLSVSFSDITEETIKLDGINYDFQKGKVSIVLNGFHATWLEHAPIERRGTLFFVIKKMFQKFIWKSSKDNYRETLIHDAHHFMDEISSFFAAQKIITTGEATKDAPVEKKFKMDTP